MTVPNSFSSGTTISSSATNANNTDIASEITGSLPRDGQAGMTGQLKADAGSTSAPGISFAADTNTGFYRKSGDVIGVVAGGTEVATVTTSGIVDANSNAVVGMPTGAMMMYGATSAPTGWVRANGRTIGNASSSATERANADTSALFTFLWTNYADAQCAVSSGRGASAAADYAANKNIALPDLRGRAFFGLDDMGNSAASRIGTTFSGTTNGATGGAENHTLTTAQLPAHSHSGTTNADGEHSHNVEYANAARDPGASGSLMSYAGTTLNHATTTAADHTHTFTTGNTGSGEQHNNMPPTFLTTFIIKL